MSRSYVAIYQNKNINYFVYFDYKKHEFFSVARKNNPLLFSLTAFSGIVFYALMKNISFGIAINPLKMLLIASISGIILGYISIKLTNWSNKKGLELDKEIFQPTNPELREFLIEGKKQFLVLIFFIVMLFFLVLASGIFLYFKPQGVLMFLVNIMFWVVSILVTWAVRPVKRYQIHKQLKGNLEEYSN